MKMRNSAVTLVIVVALAFTTISHVASETSIQNDNASSAVDLIVQESNPQVVEISSEFANLDGTNEFEVQYDLFDPKKDIDPLATNEFSTEAMNDVEMDAEASNIYPAKPYGPPPPPPKSKYPAPNYRPAPGYKPPVGRYQSPWSVLPGSYSKESYGGPRYAGNRPYNRHQVYSSYLNSKAYAAYSKQCLRSYGQNVKLSYNDLGAAFNYAAAQVKNEVNYESKQYSTGNYYNRTSYNPGVSHSLIHAAYNPANQNVQYKKEKEALFNEYASKFLLNHFCLSRYQSQYLLPSVKIGPNTGNPYGDNSCYAAYGSTSNKLYCADSKYRTLDGSCNNLYHPYWGKANVCHVRLIPAAYDDGLSTPKTKSVRGGYLPPARTISTVAHSPRPERSYYTNLKMAWGQFLQHDITFTPSSVADYKGGVIKCCPNPTHPQCFSIPIPKNDYYLSKWNQTCMEFVRSAPCPLCTLGPRQQMNQATSFIDLSLVYGNDVKQAASLRTYRDGLLKFSLACGKEILYVSPQGADGQCSPSVKNQPCFKAGDVRVNQHPGLQSLHVIFLRLHNQHARGLKRVNPRWNDEKLFQEARRLTIAQFQHVTYHEYLPIVFGPLLTKYYDLEVTYGSGYTRYEPYTDPTTWNDYIIAGRFGHSQVTSFFSTFGAKGNYEKGYWLRDSFFDPTPIHQCWLDPILKGLLTDPAQTVDPWVTGDLHNYLYRLKGEPFGLDLAAINIQRSRDHGLPGYTSYLDFCFGYHAKTWHDLSQFIPYEQLDIFKKLYADPADIDLWSGVISERKFPDADVGPTASCILGIQYYHLKYGDRYFYSHGYQTGSFSPKQVAEIKTTTLAQLLCLTSDYLDGVQKYAFFPANYGYNKKLACNSYRPINYGLFKDYY